MRKENMGENIYALIFFYLLEFFNFWLSQKYNSDEWLITHDLKKKIMCVLVMVISLGFQAMRMSNEKTSF